MYYQSERSTILAVIIIVICIVYIINTKKPQKLYRILTQFLEARHFPDLSYCDQMVAMSVSFCARHLQLEHKIYYILSTVKTGPLTTGLVTPL